jgi:hypothetical protein
MRPLATGPCRQQRGDILGRNHSRLRPDASRQNDHGLLARRDHWRRLFVEARRRLVSTSPRHRTARQQRTRDLAG